MDAGLAGGRRPPAVARTGRAGQGLWLVAAVLAALMILAAFGSRNKLSVAVMLARSKLAAAPNVSQLKGQPLSHAPGQMAGKQGEAASQGSRSAEQGSTAAGRISAPNTGGAGSSFPAPVAALHGTATAKSSSSSSSESSSGLAATTQRVEARSPTAAPAAPPAEQLGPQAAAGARAEASAGQALDPGSAAAELPCRESGYCSVGKLQPYVGRVDSTEEYRAALNASCYRRECIQVAIGRSGHLLGMNLVAGAWRLGLANVMLIASSQQSCARLAQAGYGNVTCVWSERQWLAVRGGKWGVGEAEEMWALRYILLTRAVWLGYNVWLLDNDAYLYQDPYKYLKAPPFANITFMSLRDVGNIVNGGASYIQNASPGGPAAWALAATVDRMLRVNESWEWWLQAHSISRAGHLAHAMADQFVLSDVLAGMKLGHPYISFTIPSPHVDREAGEQRLQYDASTVELPPYPFDWMGVVEGRQPDPEELEQQAELGGGGEGEGFLQDSVSGWQLAIPFLNGTWQEELAGPRFPPRGNHSSAFIQLLEQESGHRFADADGPAPAASREQAGETFIFAPSWFLSWWQARGARGYWDVRPPSQVVLHVLALPGHAPLPYKKEYVLKAHRAFHFEVAQALEGQLFRLASDAAQPPPRALALLPGLRLPSSTAAEYRDQLVWLVRLAMRLGRVLLLPEPECDSAEWVGSAEEEEPPIGHRKTSHSMDQVLSYGLDADQHCVWWPTVDAACMRGAYLVHPDYREMLHRLPARDARPGPGNTLQLGSRGAGQPAGQAAASGSSSNTTHSSTLVAEVVEAAQQKEATRVLFLSAVPDQLALLQLPPAVDRRFERWASSCAWARAPAADLG